MFPVFLTRVKTKDGLTLEGIYLKPRRKSKIAIVWLHGLSSRFSSGQTLIRELGGLCQKRGIGYLKFNNRGHDIAARGVKGLVGSGFEKFKDCVLDIKAAVNLAHRLGYRKIILAGHSTGANKALYYLYKIRDRSVKGLMLLGPINDLVAEEKRIGKRRLANTLALAKRLEGKPRTVICQDKRVYSPARYISLYNPGEAEDVFPYYNPRAKWKELKSVKAPVAVVIGGRDQFLDKSAKQFIEVFRQNAKSAKSFSGIIIKGANHGFHKKEKELSQSVIKWIKRAIA